MNILLINFGGIGDEILFLPTIISLKKAFDAKITLALEPRSKCIKDLTDTIDEVIPVDIKGANKYFELLKFVFKVQKGKFDIVISSGGNKFISILLFMTGIKKRYGYNSGRLSEILLTKSVTLNKNQYASDMYHDLISPITNIKTYLPKINVEVQEKIQNSVLIHPGVSKMSIRKGITKTIPPKVWANLTEKLVEGGKQVILAGGPDDDECIKEILQNITCSSDKFDNMYGKTKNIRELAQLIGRVEKFVCSDSAPLHIAVALKTKTYPIFGPTDYKKLVPDVDFITPITSKSNCPLKPCLWAQRQTTCDDLKCLEITAEEIFELIMNN